MILLKIFSEALSWESSSFIPIILRFDFVIVPLILSFLDLTFSWINVSLSLLLYRQQLRFPLPFLSCVLLVTCCPGCCWLCFYTDIWAFGFGAIVGLGAGFVFVGMGVSSLVSVSLWSSGWSALWLSRGSLPELGTGFLMAWMASGRTGFPPKGL